MSSLNDIYGAALLLPQSEEAVIGNLPEASLQGESTPNPVGHLPAANELPTPPSNGLAAFPAALKQESLPAYVIAPPSPSISVRSASSTLQVGIQTFTGARYRVRNHRTGSVAGWMDSGASVSVALVPNDWNLLTVDIEGATADVIRNFDINHVNPRISGNFVMHFAAHWPRFGTLAGAAWLNVQLLDLQIPASIPYISYWHLGRTGLAAAPIDRLLIAADAGGGTTGTLIYSVNPGSDDALRSPAALVALNSLLTKGWTITR